MLRRLAATLAAALAVFTATTPALAAHGWVRHGDHYVRWEIPEDRPALDAPFRTWQAFVAERSAAIEEARKANDRYEKHLRALARAAAARAAAAAQVEAQPGPSGGSGSGTVWGWVHSMFPSYQWATAECVVDHEGGWGAPVYNHQGSGAAGPFQWMPGVWPSVSAAAGYGGWSVLNIEANVGTAAHYVSVHGWTAWEPFAAYWCPGW